MKQLLIAGAFASGLVTAMGTAQSTSHGAAGPETEESGDTCTDTVFYCQSDLGCEYDGANTVACESACGDTLTVSQARALCNGCCGHFCVQGTTVTC